MRKQNDPSKGKIGISWTDWSSNPIRAKLSSELFSVDGDNDPQIQRKEKKGWACVKYGPDCENCYSERTNLRWGTGLKYSKDQLANVEFYLDEREFKEWHKVSGQRIFPCDMTDLFGEFIPEAMIQRVLQEMHDCSQNTFQVLTKRTHRLIGAKSIISDQYPNVWWGMSAGNQETLERRFLPGVANMPNLWLSLEPLIGPIRLQNVAGIEAVKWIVAGGESQTGCRTLDLDWLDNLRWDCRVLGIPLFIKQLGGHPDSRKDISKWPETLRVQEFPVGM